MISGIEWRSWCGESSGNTLRRMRYNSRSCLWKAMAMSKSMRPLFQLLVKVSNAVIERLKWVQTAHFIAKCACEVQPLGHYCLIEAMVIKLRGIDQVPAIMIIMLWKTLTLVATLVIIQMWLSLRAEPFKLVKCEAVLLITVMVIEVVLLLYLWHGRYRSDEWVMMLIKVSTKVTIKSRFDLMLCSPFVIVLIFFLLLCIRLRSSQEHIFIYLHIFFLLLY